MKAIILNSITAKKSLNFEKNVQKLLPEQVEDVYLSSCGMKRANGSGSYNYFLNLSLNNGSMITLKKLTNSSPAWDEWQDIEAGTRKHDNFNKSVCLMLLQENQDLLNEYFED